jgi:hypothetical protein
MATPESLEAPTSRSNLLILQKPGLIGSLGTFLPKLSPACIARVENVSLLVQSSAAS